MRKEIKKRILSSAGVLAEILASYGIYRIFSEIPNKNADTDLVGWFFWSMSMLIFPAPYAHWYLKSDMRSLAKHLKRALTNQEIKYVTDRPQRPGVELRAPSAQESEEESTTGNEWSPYSGVENYNLASRIKARFRNLNLPKSKVVQNEEPNEIQYEKKGERREILQLANAFSVLEREPRIFTNTEIPVGRFYRIGAAGTRKGSDAAEMLVDHTKRLLIYSGGDENWISYSGKDYGKDTTIYIDPMVHDYLLKAKDMIEEEKLRLGLSN